MARRSPSAIHAWTFSGPRNPQGRRGVFWTQIILVLFILAIVGGAAAVLIIASRSGLDLEFSGTGNASSMVFEQGVGQDVEICLLARLRAGEGVDSTGLATAQLINAELMVVRSVSVLAQGDGPGRCGGRAAIAPGIYHVEVTSPPNVSWTATVR